jgi:hypothetical protein
MALGGLNGTRKAREPFKKACQWTSLKFKARLCRLRRYQREMMLNDIEVDMAEGMKVSNPQSGPSRIQIHC